MVRPLFLLIAAVISVVTLITLVPVPLPEENPEKVSASDSNMPIAAQVSDSVSITTMEATTTIQESPKKAESKPKKSQLAAASSPSIHEAPRDDEVYRIENPYTFPPKDPDSINQMARAALVNIFCKTSSGTMNSVSGSGVIIDPRGVILTNAHVAQYVLLALSGKVDLSCFIRTGSPAQARWEASVLYIPPEWVHAHASDITLDRPKGTGEHDYALLVISQSIDGTPLPASFPFQQPDTREAIGFTSDRILIAAYPAEFSGASETNQYPSTVHSRIGRLLTFTDKDVDIISLGSVSLAQSGSSGGAVVNAWGQLIGIVTTTSEGATTAERELRAITLSYIDRDIRFQTGLSLSPYIGDDPLRKGLLFSATEAPLLAEQIIAFLQSR